MTDLTIEHEGETLYVVEPCAGALDVPGGTVEALRYRYQGWRIEHRKVADLIWSEFDAYAVTLDQRIAMLKMKAAKGDEARPVDWDSSKPVLFRDGVVGGRLSDTGDRLAEDWRCLANDDDIIAYTPLAKPATPALPTYDPATHVPVRRMTEGELSALRNEWVNADTAQTFSLWLARRLGILIEPTPPDPYEAWCAAQDGPVSLSREEFNSIREWRK